MRILEYAGLDRSGVKTGYRAITEAIARHDFRVAKVKELTNLGAWQIYRARLGDADRLLFALLRHGERSAH